MDSSDTNQNLLPLVPTATSSSNPTNSTLTKAKEEENLDVVPAKRVCFHGPYRPQNFSLPDSIIYYILKNPSSANVWEKLIKTCKYFFAKNPVAVFSNLDYYCGGWKSSFNDTAYCLDLMEITHKIWVTDQFFIFCPFMYHSVCSIPNIASSIVSKLYKCDAMFILIHCQNLFYQEFLMLVSNAEYVRLLSVRIKYEDDTAVPIEKLIEPLSKVKRFRFSGSPVMMTSKSFAELVKLPHFSSIDEFSLSGITETFDMEAFRNYMKTNKRTKFNLSFCHGLPQEYQNRLEALVDEVIVGIAEHNYPHTLIHFGELDEEKYEKMRSFYYSI